MSAPRPNLIGGAWVPGGGDPIENRNPSNPGDLVGLYAAATPAELAAAVAAARDGQRALAAMPLQARVDALTEAGRRIEAEAARIGTTLAREEGKPLAEARAEVVRAGQIFRHFAGEALRSGGLSLPSLVPGVTASTALLPLGVVAIVTPWNFPAAIPAWKIAPALAWGNAVVFKPAELACATAWELVAILHDCGLPPGAVNLVMGRGREIGDALVAAPGIDGVSFTGSEPVGLGIAAAAAPLLRRVQLELGGKNPLVVADDADLALAVEVARVGAFAQTGQRCTAWSRIIVMDAIHDAFVAAFAAAADAMVVGDACDPATQMGPAVDARQLRQDHDYIALGQAEGARLATAPPDLPGPGHFLRPAVLVDGRPEMRLAREEVFGPVALVLRAESFEAAVSLANDTPYGLTAGIVTASAARAEAFRRASTAGVVMTNLPPVVDYHLPFGGRGRSGLGPGEMGPAAREFFTVTQASYSRWS
jgi:acyl-CoA reductase-like NAD-dependent aldehyde dehydrogenase